MKRLSTDRLSALTVFAFLALVVACGAQPSDQPEAAAPQAAAEPEAEPTAAGLIRNGVMVEEDVLAGGQPTPEELTALAEAGYRTVLNMRLPDESDNTDPAFVEELGMAYVDVPIEGAAGLSEERAIQFAEALAEVERPVVVHCGSGNRVGALFALKAYYVDGKSADEAMQIGLDAGMTRLESAVAEHLAMAEASGE
jgi:uncharacterized protein (TIGR01244 family)